MSKATKLKQAFANRTSHAIFLNLELSTSRFRLNPGEELVLLYDPRHRSWDEDGNDSPLRIEIVPGPDGHELVIWTAESEMFHTDGRKAQWDFGRL